MRSQRPAGFTLVEVLLALSIGAALLVVVFGGVRAGLAAWGRGEARAMALEHDRSLEQLLAQTIAGAFPYRGNVARPGASGVFFDGQPDRITLVTTAPPIPAAIPIAFTAVHVSRDEQGLAVRQLALPNLEPVDRIAALLVDSRGGGASLPVPGRGGRDVERSVGDERGGQPAARRGDPADDGDRRSCRGAASARGLHPGPHTMRREGGFVLISVLLALALLALVVTEFVFSMRLEASMARSYRDSVLAEHLAEAGVQQAIREILGQAQIVAPDEGGQLVFYRALPGQTQPRRLPILPRAGSHWGGASSPIASRTSRRASTSTRRPRFGWIGCSPRWGSAGRSVTSSTIPFRTGETADELRRLNGAESDDTYLRIPVPYRSRNGNIQDVAELRQIRGVSPELYAGTAERPGSR
jgi:prepilin-type N-terminal cleavage/methylation domain-containing protein